MSADATQNTKIQLQSNGDVLNVSSGGTVNVDSGGTIVGKQMKRTVRSESFDLDNGAGATIDRVVLYFPTAVTITRVNAVYEDATTGTVAAGNFKVGTTVGGGEIVAATAYENAKAVGVATPGTIVSGAVPANTPVCVRHTGVAATQAGRASIHIEYTVDA